MSISQLFPEEGPSLSLNLAGSRTLDPRITFTRTSSGTRTNSQGLIEVVPENYPRFDHRYANGEIESLGLLIERVRTNLKIRSEELQFDFSRASITTISENEIISPDGLQTADGIVPNATLGSHYLDKVFTSTSGITTSQNICCSAFFKKGVGRDVWLQIYEESGNAYHGVQFDFETETLTFRNSNEYITGGGVTTDYGVMKYPNGWYRLWVAGYPNTTTTGRRYRIRLTDASGGLEFSGDAVSSYVYPWGVQVEIGAYPTSYIPTVASTVTRNQDRVLIDGERFLQWYNPVEGTFFCSTNDPRGTVVFGVGNTFDNTIYTTVGGSFSGTMRSGGSGTSFVGTISNSGTSKVAFGVKTDNSALCINGVITGSSLTADMPINPIRLTLGASAWSPTAGDNQVDGTISQLIYYPTRLPNAQLVSLTR
jgi:hypothetical protein